MTRPVAIPKEGQSCPVECPSDVLASKGHTGGQSRLKRGQSVGSKGVLKAVSGAAAGGAGAGHLGPPPTEGEPPICPPTRPGVLIAATVPAGSSERPRAQRADAWPQERVDELVILWNRGVSASECAKLLFGDKAKEGAVFGKLHRLGLTNMATRRPASSFQVARKPVRSRPGPLPILVAFAEPSARTLRELDGGDCKWPVGEATGADQLFCGEAVESGPYCPGCIERRKPYLPHERSEKVDAALERWIRRQLGL